MDLLDIWIILDYMLRTENGSTAMSIYFLEEIMNKIGESFSGDLNITQLLLGKIA